MGFALTLIVVTWLVARWFHVVELTYAQRVGLLAGIHDPDPLVAIKKLDLLGDVPFGAHLWRLTTFRDPWALYPAGLADEIKAVR